MSGFELERQSLSEKLTRVTEVSKRLTGDEMNRELLRNLQQSSDIVRDLWALYSDRPYVYARVMQQLGKVMGKAQLRKIHNDVLARSKAAAESAQKTLKPAQKPALKSSKAGSTPLKSDDKTGAKPEDEGEKEFTVNLPKLGLNNVKVKVASAEGQHRLSASQLPIPFLKSVSGAISYHNKKVSKITAKGQLGAALMESAQVDVEMTRVGTEGSNYTPNVKIGVAKLKIPGLDDGLTTQLAMTNGEKPGFEGEIAGASKILSDVSVNGKGKVKTGGDDTSIDGSLEISQSAGGKSGGKSGGKNAAAASAGVSYTGSVTINAANGTVSAAKGTLSLTNVSKLADPKSAVDLEIDYNGASFTAQLLNSVTFAEYEFKGGAKTGNVAGGGKKGGSKNAKATTVQLTIDKASYDGGLDANCTISTKLGGIIQADGTVNIEKNNLTGGQVTLNAEEVPIIGNKAFLTTTLSGDIAIDEQGFSGTATGNAKFKVGCHDIAINLDESTFASDGQFSGKVSLAQPVEFKPLKFETLVADFASNEGLTHVDGLLSLDTPRIKSDENGIKVTYADEQLDAAGKLKLLGAAGAGGEGGGDEMATCDFKAKLSADAFKGTGDFVVTQDYKVGTTKLQILKDSTATVTLTEAEIEPIKFAGKYDYGHAAGAGGGAGGKGGEGAAQGAKQGDGKSDKSGGAPLQFKGDFNGCTYDVNSGMLNGSATAILESDIEYKSPLVDVKIDSKRRTEQSQFDVQIVDSAVDTLSGTLCYEADVPLKSGKGKGKTLSVEGKVADFTLRVAEEKFSGTIKNSLRKDLWLVGDTKGANTLKLTGNLRNNLTFVVDNNEISSIEVDAEAETKITHRYFEEGSEKFTIKLKDAQVNKDTLGVTSDQATITPMSDVKMVFGADQHTKLTVGKSSIVTASIQDSEIQSITLNAGFNGETKALKTDTPIEFKGTSDFTVLDIQGKGKVDGDIEVSTTKDCIIDAIEEVDEIKLRKGAKFGLKMSDTEIDKVSGSMAIDYKVAAGNIGAIPDGFAARLKCANMTYRPKDKKFSGSVSVQPVKDIVFKPGSGGKGGGEGDATGADGSFTLKSKGTGLKATLKDNDLKSLTGSAGFEAKAALKGTQNDASATLTDGKASLNIDVDTGEIHELKVTSKVQLDAQLSDKLKIHSEEGSVEAEFDSQGIVSACFKGKINLDLKLKNDETALFVVDSGQGVNYTRETGFGGLVTLSCQNRVKLGQISNGKYEYGLGGDKGAAASIDVNIENSEINRIFGKAGLYLEEKSEDEEASLLKVRGNIEFDYDIANEKLVMAKGKAVVDEKELCSVGKDNKLILKKSSVEVSISNNELGIKGKVNLALADGDGDYMSFESEEEFDCTGEMDKFSAKVKGQFTREKSIGKSGTTEFFVSDKGAEIGTSFICDIQNNEIESLEGGFGIVVKTDGTPLFQGGIVDGKYNKADGTFGGTGKIELLKDLELPKGSSQFALKATSGGEAKLENGVIKDIEGNLIIGIKAPKVNGKSSGSEIIVENHAKLDVESQTIEEFNGTATLKGEKFEIANGLSLTSLSGSVDIKKNKLEEIAGGACIEFTKDDFKLTGDCREFGWKKGENGSNDVIHFDGGLTVDAFDGRLHGKADVQYNSDTPELTATGELDFKITDWLLGKVNVEFPNGSWDNPTIKGRLEAKDVELVPARTLMAFGKDLKLAGLNAMAGPVPITAEAGIGVGASIDMEAIRINANLDIGPFELNDLKGGALPDFEIGLDATTGLQLSANISPYISVGLGVTGFSAGIRVRGKAELDASASGAVGGKLKGGKQGLAGELELGFGVSASASLSISPELYAQILGYNPKYKIAEFKYDLGNIFKFDWSKKFSFGDKGATSESEGSVKTDLPSNAKQTKAEAKKGEEAKYKAKESSGAGAVEKGKPQLPKAGDVGKKSIGQNVGSASDVKGTDSVVTKIKKVAEGMSAIGDAVSFISNLVKSFVAGGAIGVAVYVAIQVFTGKLSLATIKAKVNAIKDGFEALKDLIKGGWRQFLPPKLLEIADFVIQARENGMLQKVLEAIDKKVKSMTPPMNRIMAPMVDFLKERTEALGQLAEKMVIQNMSFTQLIKVAAGLVGFAISSPIALLKTAGRMGSVVKQIISECIASGLIYVHYTESKNFIGMKTKDYKWQIKIPGLCDWKGTSSAVALALRAAGIKAKKVK